jgi:nuclear transport factor 2 (NTF2) superfamily protein
MAKSKRCSMLSSLGSYLSVASLLGSVVATCQPGPANRPPAIPYTAEFRTTTIRTLADGTTIKRETKSVQARDSQWRVFTEFENETPNGGNNAPRNTIGTINDSTGGSDVTWQSRNREAVTIKYPPPVRFENCIKYLAIRTRVNHLLR